MLGRPTRQTGEDAVTRSKAGLLTSGAVLAVLAACGPMTGGGTGGEVPHAAAAPAGLAPPPGRTPAERAEARAHYRGPRGEEF
jgi:hypothetical protein